MRLMQKINNTTPEKDSIALFYIAQAGFCIRTSTGKTIVIDPYLSDACERLFHFKRMIPTSILADELDPDLYLCTHHHTDHLDPITVPVVAENKKTKFVAAPDCEFLFRELKIPQSRYIILREGEQCQEEGIQIRAIYADHGELAPEAVGFLIEVDGVKIYHAGDTAFRPEQISTSLRSSVDLMIAPINGQFGNMIASEACQLALLINPEILIPCHFWMFLEHVADGGQGDPATFLKLAISLPKSTRPMVMAPGELFTYTKRTA